MTNDIKKGEEEDNLHSKRRHESVALDSSLKSTSKKQKLETGLDSLNTSENGDYTLSGSKKKRKKNHTENGVVDREKSEAEISHESIGCWTSTPMQYKKKRSSLDNEGRKELELDTGKEVFTNKVSKSGKSFPFFTELLSRLNQRVNADKDVSETLESANSENKTGNDKKRKKKKKRKNDTSLTCSESEEIAGSNDSGSKTNDSYTIDVYDSQSEVFDGSFTKKNKKKVHQEKELIGEKMLGTDYFESQRCSESEGMQSDAKKKKKKKKENHEHIIDDSFTSDFSVGSNNKTNQQDESFIKKKKKRKHKRELSCGEISSLSEGENMQSSGKGSDMKNTNTGEINCDHISNVSKKIKHSKSESSFEEKHEGKISLTNQNGDIDKNVKSESSKKDKTKNQENTTNSTKPEKQSLLVIKKPEKDMENTNNGEINWDHISNISKKIKRTKSESSLEEKHKGKNSLTNHNSDIDENVKSVSSKKVAKPKNQENTTNFIKPEKQSPLVIKKPKKDKKKKKKKDHPIKVLLSDYKIKSKKKSVTPWRKHSVLLEKSGEECEKSIEEKPKPFEVADLSLVEILKDIKDKSRLGDEEAEKLSKLDVLVPWPVPPQHLIETRVAGSPTERDRKTIEALGVTVKTGKFSKMEDEQIRKNWRKFCKMHDLPDDPTPFLNFATPDRKKIISSESRINFARFLAHNLENRLLCSVYNRFKRLFSQGTINSGRFTPKEDKIIVEFLRTCSSSTPYADLAKLLNRNKLSIEKRCLKLAAKVSGDDAPLKWNKEFIEEFMQHLVDITGVENVEEFKSREITPEEWKELSYRLDIPVLKLREGWNYSLYSRVFVKERLFTRDVKERLIEKLIERQESDWRSVNWEEIAQEFEGFTGNKLNRMLKDAVSYHVPLRLQSDLKASLLYLQDNPLKMNRFKRRKIRRLKILDNRETE